ncbi:MAG: methyltransferase domain-containing protein [Hyphomicrobiaceae bacterium]|nr:methyltransferase domain-containing protein [Hyphomicrobiaceae bacterium]
MSRDPHRYVNELDEAAIERLISRLEARAKDRVFTTLFDNYMTKIISHAPKSILEIGSGTGSMMRSLARRRDYSGRILGIEQSPVFVDAARRLASEEGLADRVDFHVGDAHKLDVPDRSFDAVILNTVLSHVSDTMTVLGEATRVVKPGGVVAIFDGDYGSMTYAHPDVDLAQRMNAALVQATFNNVYIMRELPRILPQLGLEIAEAWGDAVTEIGDASFFKSFAATYVPYVKDAGLAPAHEVDEWYAYQESAMSNRTFFGSCIYYTFLARRRS